MLVKLNEGSYISKHAIHEVCIMQKDNKAVRIYGEGFKFVAVFDTDKEADACLLDVVSKINDINPDISAYTWDTFK